MQTTRRIAPVARLVLSACSLSVLPACARIVPYQLVEPAPEEVAAFDLPLRMNEAGVLFVTLDSSLGPLELLLDTGADHPLLIRHDNERFGALPTLGHEWTGRASGTLKRSRVCALPTLDLGPLRYSDVAATVEESSFPPFMECDGMLGRRLLEGFTLDIDAPGGRLGCWPRGQLPPGVATDGAGWMTIDIDDLDDGPVIVATLGSDTTPRRLVLDTGAIAITDEGPYGIIELPADIAPSRTPEGAPPILDACMLETNGGPLGPFTFYVIEHRWPPNTHGFLGNALFTTHRVVIDFEGRQLFIRRAQS